MPRSVACSKQSLKLADMQLDMWMRADQRLVVAIASHVSRESARRWQGRSSKDRRRWMEGREATRRAPEDRPPKEAAFGRLACQDQPVSTLDSSLLRVPSRPSLAHVPCRNEQHVNKIMHVSRARRRPSCSVTLSSIRFRFAAPVLPATVRVSLPSAAELVKEG